MRKHGTNTTPVFLPADGEASWSLLPSSVSLLSDGTVSPENTYYHILRVTGQVWENQKRISINANLSYHQCSSLSASLNWSNNKARSSFNQPNRKRWGAKLVYVKHLPNKAFLSWHHTRGSWGKTDPVGHQPSILMSGGWKSVDSFKKRKFVGSESGFYIRHVHIIASLLSYPLTEKKQ